MKDPRLKYATKEEQEQLSQIRDPKLVADSLEILEFLNEQKTKKQYMSQKDFGRYLPLYSTKAFEKYREVYGADKLADLINEFYNKYEHHNKEIYLVEDYHSKKVICVLPAAATVAPSIRDTDILGNRAVDNANRKINTQDREDIALEGQNELIAMMNKARTEDAAVRKFAEDRFKTEKLTKTIDELRDAYYRELAGLSPATDKEKSSETVEVFSNDDEVLD